MGSSSQNDRERAAQGFPACPSCMRRLRMHCGSATCNWYVCGGCQKFGNPSMAKRWIDIKPPPVIGRPA